MSLERKCDVCGVVYDYGEICNVNVLNAVLLTGEPVRLRYTADRMVLTNVPKYRMAQRGDICPKCVVTLKWLP
jgi:hypothetical protein